MAILNIENFTGLDTRSKKINQQITSASEMVNMQLNIHNDLEKRNGYSKKMDLTNVKFMSPFEADGEMIAIRDFSGTSLQFFDNQGNSWAAPKLNSVNFSAGNLYSTCQYDGSFYFNNTKGSEYLLKFDRSGFYRAGVPKPRVDFIDHVAGDENDADARYYRVFLAFTDATGKKHYGDYYETPEKRLLTGTKRVYVDHADDDGFCYTACKVAQDDVVAVSQGSYGSFKADNSKLLLYPGQQFRAFADVRTGQATATDYPYEYWCRVILIQDNGDGTSQVTFSLAKDYALSGQSIYLWFAQDQIIGPYWEVYLFESIDKTTGYTFSYSHVEQLSGNADTMVINAGDVSNDPNYYLEDIYDPQIIKGLPPKCKYIDIKDNIMIMAGSLKNDNELYWSDLSVGSTIETFAPLDHLTIGKTSEGIITAVKSYYSGIAVFKKRSVYIIKGNLPLGKYTIKNYFNNQVGCIDNNAAEKFGNGIIFVSERGLYAIEGNTLTELSKSIRGEFENPVWYASAVRVDQLREKIYVKVGSRYIYVLDITNRSWYKWDGLPQTAGFCVLTDRMNSVKLFYPYNNAIYYESSRKSDNGSAIDAWYTTSWIDLDSPDLRKKFTETVIKSLYGEEFDVEIASECNWIENSDREYIKKHMDSPIMHHNLNNEFCHSARITFRNRENEQDLKISGISVEVENTQRETRVR